MIQNLFFKRCWDCRTSFEKQLEAALHCQSHQPQVFNSTAIPGYSLLAFTSLLLLICPPHVSFKHLSQFISPAWVRTLCVGFSSFFPLVLDFLMGWLEKKNVSSWPSFLSAKYASVLKPFKTVSVCWAPPPVWVCFCCIEDTRILSGVRDARQISQALCCDINLSLFLWEISLLQCIKTNFTFATNFSCRRRRPQLFPGDPVWLCSIVFSL